MIHFGILHAVQREVPTIDRCIRSMRQAGITEMAVYADDGSLGAWGNFRRALGAMIRGAHPTDRICIMLDDCVLHARALEKVADRDQEAVHTLITIEQDIPHHLRGELGWIQANAGWNSWGGLHVFPWPIAVRMQEQRIWRESKMDPKAPIDGVVFEALNQMNVPVYQHLPSLADHIGTTSTLEHGELTADRRGFRFNEWR